MRSSWITYVGPKSNDRCSCKKKSEGYLTHKYPPKWPETEIGDMLPQAKEYLKPPDGRTNERFFLRVLEFGTLASRI